MSTTPEPVLITNPDSDDAFRAAAHEAIESGAASPPALQAALRVAYPNAVVNPREISTELRVVWYVYREGHWIR